MPATISLECYSKDFSTSTNIDYPTLLQIVATDETLKIEQGNLDKTLFIWSDEEKDWFPLLWLSENSNAINSTPIFSLNLFNDLCKLAKQLNACIIAEDGCVLFLPQYGVVFDPEEANNQIIGIWEVEEAIKQTENLALAIRNIERRKKATNQLVLKAKKNPPKAFTYLWIKTIIAILLALLLIISLLK
jgi:hypothetical protein